MKLYIFFVEKTQIEKFNALIPASKRSKILRDFIKNNVTDIDLLNGTEIQGEETISFYLDPAANNKIELMVMENQCNRSSVMRAVLAAIINHYTEYPLEVKKGLTRTFTVNEGTLEHLKPLIAHGERDAIIEDFLMNSYAGPQKSVSELKARPKGSETMIVKLTEESLEKLEQFAESIGDKVKRSHIFKDMIEQLITSRQAENVQRLKLENTLVDTVIQLKEVAPKNEIKKLINTVL